MSQGSFLEALKTYLQRLTQPQPSAEADESSIDPVWARNLLLRTLSKVEAGDADRHYSPEELDCQLDDWQQGDRVVVFARQLARLLKHGLVPGANRAMLEELIELGLARWFHLPRELPSHVMTSQLDRLVDEAKTLAWQSSQVFVGMDVVRYAKSNRLTVMQDGRPRPSRLAEVLQHLEGRDAVRWLLQVESQQALGQFDPDRLSREAAFALLRAHSWMDNDSYDDGSDCPCSLNIANRLYGMGILEVESITDVRSQWSVSLLGQELLSEVIEPNRTPLALLAASLCSDFMTSAMTVTIGSQMAFHSSAAEATTNQARMVAHEVRNALLPVQAALDSLYREVLTLPPSEVLARRRKTIDDGVRGGAPVYKDAASDCRTGGQAAAAV